MVKVYDVAIAGGGIIGLASAYFLAGAGARVIVLERGRVGQEASWAAAGMLAAASEVERSDPFGVLCLASRARYAEWTAALREETGIDCELSPAGLLHVARDEREAAHLRDRLDWQRRYGLRAEWLTASELRQLEPDLSETLAGGALYPDDRQVNNRRVVEALYASCIGRGVEVREGVEVIGVRQTANRYIAWRTPGEDVHAARLVWDAGAWSARAADWLGVPLPVQPVRGQIVELRLPGNLRHVIYAAGTCYLAPKPQSRLLVGATSETAGFEKRTTAGALARLVAQGATVCPAINDAEWRAAWAGLRPGTRDGWPILGPLPQHPEVILATGHFRNGILLAPITGLLVKSLALGQPVPINWRPFGVHRFTKPTAATGEKPA